MRADSMSRQAAIDVLKRNYPSSCFEDLCKAVDIAIKALSEQPEIIRCEECMHNGTVDTDCPILWGGREFCSFGERRADV